MIRLAAASASSNALYTVDDPTTDTDLGAQFTALLRTTPFDNASATGWSTLRRLVQVVAVNGAVTAAITPSVDGQDFTGQRVVQTFDPTDGPEQFFEVSVWTSGTRFRMQLEITSHVGLTEVGESDQWFIGRRTTRLN